MIENDYILLMSSISAMWTWTEKWICKDRNIPQSDLKVIRIYFMAISIIYSSPLTLLFLLHSLIFTQCFDIHLLVNLSRVLYRLHQQWQLMNLIEKNLTLFYWLPWVAMAWYWLPGNFPMCVFYFVRKRKTVYSVKFGVSHLERAKGK